MKSITNLIFLALFYVVIFNSIFILNTYAEILGDINNDNIVDTTEAVYALEVASGIKNVIIKESEKTWNEKNGNIYFNSGKVGIGLDNPNSNLSVKGNCSTKLSGYVGVPSGSKVVIGVNTLFATELKISDTVEIGNEKFIVDEIVSDTQLVLNTYHKSGANNSAIYTDADLLSIQDSNGMNKLIVDKSGNVGIGTNKPKGTLDLNGGNLVNVDWENSKIGKGSGLIPDIIVCYKEFELTGSWGEHTIYFSDSDCGGTLPDTSYIGTANTMWIAGGHEVFSISNEPPRVIVVAEPKGKSLLKIIYYKYK